MRNATSTLLIAALMIAIGSISGIHARAQRSEARGSKAGDPQDKASLWMRHKLVASQKILEGMTRADYEMIEKNAAAMQVMGHLEAWVRADRPEYKAQLHAFEHANGAIVFAAKDRNLDGVTIAYTQLTISCVQCHKLIRDKVKE